MDLTRRTPGAPTANYLLFGDNIVECTRAAALIVSALTASHEPTGEYAGPAHRPVLSLHPTASGGIPITLHLRPGYGRWPIEPADLLAAQGAPLREASDATIVDASTGKVILAIEFCSALPAGNNAWQRAGRALSAAQAGVPFLLIAEIGGVELGKGRQVKGSRLPNPVIPLAYSFLDQSSREPVVMQAVVSPTCPSNAREDLAAACDATLAQDLVQAVFLGAACDEIARVRARAADAAQTVATAVTSLRRPSRSKIDQAAVAALGAQPTAAERADLLLEQGKAWQKSITIPTTATFQRVMDAVRRASPRAVGDSAMPIGLIASDRRPSLADALRKIYGERLADGERAYIGRTSRPLAVVYIAGFKPGGEDSRPDRGLVPLARMILGDATDLLAVVYGPAPANLLGQVFADPLGACTSNGLWASVLTQADVIVIDGPKAPDLQNVALPTVTLTRHHASGLPAPPITGGLADGPDPVGEHDVDSVLHVLFSSAPSVFECMCNPPGGDWSGLNFAEQSTGRIYRWSSLKRVSGDRLKRPDHVALLLDDPPLLLAVESKGDAGRLEEGVGPALTSYVAELLEHPPNCWREAPGGEWIPNADGWVPFPGEIRSVGAFLMPAAWPASYVERAGVDLAVGVELGGPESPAVLHVQSRRGDDLLDRFRQITSPLADRVIVQEH